MEPRATELTVSDAAHAERLELAYGLGDRSVLDSAQLGGGDLVGGTARSRLVHGRGPQQAADMVGAERRIDGGHDRAPPHASLELLIRAQRHEGGPHRAAPSRSRALGSSRREVTPSLTKARDKWFSTVRSETTRRAAMSRLDSPRAARAAISRSRAVSCTPPVESPSGGARPWHSSLSCRASASAAVARRR